MAARLLRAALGARAGLLRSLLAASALRAATIGTASAALLVTGRLVCVTRTWVGLLRLLGLQWWRLGEIAFEQILEGKGHSLSAIEFEHDELGENLAIDDGSRAVGYADARADARELSG